MPNQQSNSQQSISANACHVPRHRVSRHGARRKPSWLNRTQRTPVCSNSFADLCIDMAFLLANPTTRSKPNKFGSLSLEDEDQNSPSKNKAQAVHLARVATADEPESSPVVWFTTFHPFSGLISWFHGKLEPQFPGSSPFVINPGR